LRTTPALDLFATTTTNRTAPAQTPVAITSVGPDSVYPKLPKPEDPSLPCGLVLERRAAGRSGTVECKAKSRRDATQIAEGTVLQRDANCFG